jgi:predicted GIY-YIG superfamily endonuclease
VSQVFVYMLECADGSLYVGSTAALEARLAQHAQGLVVHTCKRLPVAMAYSTGFPSLDEARIRERQLKGWSHAKKRALIVGDWARVHELARRGRKSPMAASETENPASKAGARDHPSTRGSSSPGSG